MASLGWGTAYGAGSGYQALTSASGTSWSDPWTQLQAQYDRMKRAAFVDEQEEVQRRASLIGDQAYNGRFTETGFRDALYEFRKEFSIVDDVSIVDDGKFRVHYRNGEVSEFRYSPPVAVAHTLELDEVPDDFYGDPEFAKKLHKLLVERIPSFRHALRKSFTK